MSGLNDTVEDITAHKFNLVRRVTFENGYLTRMGIVW